MYTKLSDTIHELVSGAACCVKLSDTPPVLHPDGHLQDSMQIEEGLIPEAYKQCGADELFDYIVCKLLVFAESIGR